MVQTLEEEERGPRPLSVLVVEDEPLILMSLVDILRDDGLEIFAASDAEEAINLLEFGEVIVDLVFTDVRFPHGRNGFEFTRWLRAHRPEILIAVTSGQVAGSAANRELLEGELFIEKPYLISQLADQLEAFARASDRVTARRRDL